MPTFGPGRKEYYKAGDWNSLCGRCALRFKFSELIEEWTGHFVCKDCWEPRHPQDFVRGVPETNNVFYTLGENETDIDGGTYEDPVTTIDDADYTTESDDDTILYNTELTANRAVTLSTSGLIEGQRIQFYRTKTDNFKLDVGGLTDLDIPSACVVEWGKGVTLDQSVTTAEDSTSNNNDGTLQNDPQWAPDEVTDQIVGALSFQPATSDAVDVPHDTSMDATSAMTVETWVYWDQDDDLFPKAMSRGSNDHPFSFYLANSGAFKPWIRVQLSGGESDFHRGAISTLNTGQWYHVAIAVDAQGGESKLYVDGALQHTETFASQTINTNTNDLTLGNDRERVHSLAAKLSDERLWVNVARTQQQIQDNMNTRLNGDETGLAGYWRLDDGYLADGVWKLERKWFL